VVECVPMHWPAAPTACAGNRGEQVGPNAPVDLHAVRIPIVFFDSCEAFVFFGTLAFGFRTSLFDLFCPLAMILGLPASASRLSCSIGSAGVEILF